MAGDNPQNQEHMSASALGEGLAAARKECRQMMAAVDIEAKRKQIGDIDAVLAQGWDKVENASELQRKRARLQEQVAPLEMLDGSLDEQSELLELAAEEKDQTLLADIGAKLRDCNEQLAQQRLALLLRVPHSQADAYLDIQFGSGGTESQDWAQMLKRMYVGYCAERGWKTTVIDETPGEAGIKSATLNVSGLNAYGMLRTETGVHRLVRKSPYDSSNRRHTTFASVFVYPVLDEAAEVSIDPGDLRIDTYRSSGAGGQHVNTTDSAVRITHLPTNIVVQSQNSRSQHSNRATAMSMLKSRLEMLRKQEQDAKKQELEESKADISWGSQIRSYVLDQSRIKDLRTGHESGNTQAVLDGDGLHQFIEASLHAGL